MIYLDKKGRRIHIRADEPLPGLRAAIPGAYETVGGTWTVPLSLESARLIQQKYGRDRLRVSNELRRWAESVKQNRETMANLAKAEDAKLDILPSAAPKLYHAMRKRKYQKVGVRFLADNAATLLADEPGLGKTLTAMGGLLEAGVKGPYLVIAPKTASESVWRREIRRWLPMEHRAVALPQLRYQRDYLIRTVRYTEHTWLVVHPEIVMVQAWWACDKCPHREEAASRQKTLLSCGHPRTRNTKTIIEHNFPKLFEIQWGAIIADESHEILIRRSGVPTQRRRGMDMLQLRPDGIKLALSGTPFDSKPEQLWGTLNWLMPETYSAFHRWAELYWEKGGRSEYFRIGEFRKEREKLLWDSLNAVALRRTKLEVAKDLPPKIYVGTPLDPMNENGPVGIWLKMEGAQERAYRQMQEMSIADLESGRIEAIYALEELTRLKQLACAFGDIKEIRHRDGIKHQYMPRVPSNKLNWILEATEEWGFPKTPLTKVVICSWYSGILRLFAKEISAHYRVRKDRPLVTGITGKTPQHLRAPIIDEFNKRDRNTPQIMMLNIKAGGTAISIDSADRMIFISETRSPNRQEQAEDRIHRVSNPRQCMYYYLRSLDTVDIGIAVDNAELAKESHRLLDQRRGVDYVRRILDLSRGTAPS